MLNSITIQGRLVKDAEDKLLNSGKVITNFCVAVQRNYKNSKGEYDADYIDCLAFDKVGEHIAKYFHKGDMILVTGELQTKIYEDKNGVKHKVSMINVAKSFFAGEKKSGSKASDNTASVSDDEELPFE